MKWRLQSFASRADIQEERIDWAADQIREASGGMIDIAVFYDGELIPPKEAFQACADGIIEMAHSSTGYHVGFMPECSVVYGLPGTVRSEADVFSLCHDPRWGLHNRLAKAYEEHNLYTLPKMQLGKPQALFLKEEVKSLDELATRKLRSYGSTGDYVALSGAEVVYLPLSEVYTAMATGVIDGSTRGSYAAFQNGKYQELGNYYLPMFQATLTSGIQINMDAWNEVPDPVKAIVNYYFYENMVWTSIMEQLDNEVAEVVLKEDWGWVDINLPPADVADWVSRGKTLWEEYAAQNARSREWVDITYDWMRWRGYME